MPSIALIHQHNARSVRTWSGTSFFSSSALEKHLGPVDDFSPWPQNPLVWKVIEKSAVMLRRNYSHNHARTLAKRYGAYFTKRLRESPHDLVYSPAGSAAIAYLETDKPIISYSDITWRIAVDYHACYTGLVPWNRRDGEELERLALEKSSLVLLSSEWAARSVIDDYGIDPKRVAVVYIGANLASPPSRQKALAPRASAGPLRLLFIGVSWVNKGGPIARETLVRLLDMGIDAELTVLGCHVPSSAAHPRMRTIRYLNKQIPEESARFDALWDNADIFLLPTRFEAAGIVFCEAAAHGLPAVATRTGGVPSLIVDGDSGLLLDYTAGGAEYAQCIASQLGSPEQRAAMGRTARDIYEERLNWDAWGMRVAELVRTRIGNGF